MRRSCRRREEGSVGIAGAKKYGNLCEGSCIEYLRCIAIAKKRSFYLSRQSCCLPSSYSQLAVIGYGSSGANARNPA